MKRNGRSVEGYLQKNLPKSAFTEVKKIYDSCQKREPGCTSDQGTDLYDGSSVREPGEQ